MGHQKICHWSIDHGQPCIALRNDVASKDIFPEKVTGLAAHKDKTPHLLTSYAAFDIIQCCTDPRNKGANWGIANTEGNWGRSIQWSISS